MNTINRQWRIVGRPEGQAGTDHFEWHEEPVPVPGPGQVLVRNLVLSLDPTNRLWMWERDTYLPAQKLGQVMRGIAVGRVERSESEALPVGTLVSGLLGWQDYAVADARAVNRLPADPAMTPELWLGLLGHIGITAYFGVTDVGKLKAGETMLVSGAAGAVGSLACQIGRILGARVVGVAGTADKCRWLVDELGCAVAIDYRREDLVEGLARCCPEGVDVYFDNVGGPMLEPVLDRMNLHGRVAVCGAISQYNRTDVSQFDPGPRNLFLLVVKRLRMQGFLTSDFASRAGEAIRALSQWHRDGLLRFRLHEVEGLENAPAAMNMLFVGTNLGKLMVRIAR